MLRQIRDARPQDAPAMACVLNEIISLGGTTAFRQPFNTRSIIDAFIAPPRGISCVVVTEGSELLGFQALEWSDPDWPGEDRFPADWAVISTFVAPSAQNRGIGRALFANTASAAREASVRFIAAPIRKENRGGQAFYQAIGFVDYCSGADTVCKRFGLD